MSDLLNKASLVMIPSGYKEDVVYSAVPGDGSGDMAFTRASNGTRVNSAGLVEVCPWNLLEQSETFDNAYWSKFQCSVTANDTIAPNGTTTAEKVIASTNGAGVVYISDSAYINGVYNLSVYAKAGNQNKIYLEAYGVGGTACATNINLSTQTIISQTNFTNINIEDVGNGWYKISATFSNLGGSIVTLGFGMASSVSTNDFAYFWGAQLNIGATAKPYFPTTDRLNVPRLTYQNGGGGCPSLLLEKQSTNLLQYSEQFDNAPWTLDGNGVGQSVTANYSISPDGTQNADRLQLNKTGGTYSRIRQDNSGAGTYAWTVYMKSNTSNNQNVGLRLDSTGINCVVTPTWQRFTLNATVGTPQVQILLFDSISGNDETADISIWGAQLETSSYPTSYINTTSASATRVADACFKTGISSLIGQSEGTIFADINPEEFVNGSYLGITDGTITNRIILGFESGSVNSGTLLVFGLSGLSSGGTYTRGQRIKVALAYKSGDSVLYVNGSQVQTATTTFSGSFSQFRFDSFAGTQNFIGKVNESLLSKTRLTNAELASITSL